jgi:hypothetical protein
VPQKNKNKSFLNIDFLLVAGIATPIDFHVQEFNSETIDKSISVHRDLVLSLFLQQKPV